MNTLFMKVIRGEIPSYKVYEDEHTYAFLDLNQCIEGRVLIVPKVQVDRFYDLEDPYYQAIFSTARILAPVLQKTFNPARVGLVLEWLEVPHVHVKLIPIGKLGDIDGQILVQVSAEEMLETQKKIIDNLN